MTDRRATEQVGVAQVSNLCNVPQIGNLCHQVQRIVAIHFDPDTGSPYWLDRQRELELDVRRVVRTIDDLSLLGPMDETALASRPIEDFVPRSQVGRGSRAEWIVAETAGTLGRPKFAVHRQDEFEAAFIAPFVAAADRVGFPRGVNWLFIGPSGPHVIGKAARRCAQALQSPDPFTVDLDPRWAKKLPGGSFAARRYLEHVENQALAVLESQRVGVIFSTPVVLESLGPRIPPDKRAEIRGIHLGGLAVSAAARANFADRFPNAIILSGYGNTLFGMMPGLSFSPDTGFDYYPHGVRLVVRVIEYVAQPPSAVIRPPPAGEIGPRAGRSTPEAGVPHLLSGRLNNQVAYGQRGQVVVHRLDETQFIANMVERDTAIRIPAGDCPLFSGCFGKKGTVPLPCPAADGFVLDGLRDPQPIVNETVKPATGLY